MPPKEAKKPESVIAAEKFMEEGKKHASKGIFKKPDWEKAAFAYAQAVKQYRLSGAAYNRPCIEALRLSGAAHKEIGSLNTAAVDLEKAGGLAKEEKDFPLAVELYKAGSRCYRANNQPDKAASLLVSAANTLEANPDAAISLFEEACAIHEEEKKSRLFEETFTKAIIFAIKFNKLDAALMLISRENLIYELEMDTFADQLWKNYLQSMVILYHQGKYSVAEQQFRDSEAKHGEFAGSECYSAGIGLIAAYESGDQKELTDHVTKQGIFKYLNNQCARLAKNLTFSPEVIAARAEAKRLATPATPEESVDDGSDDRAGLE